MHIPKGLPWVKAFDECIDISRFSYRAVSSAARKKVMAPAFRAMPWHEISGTMEVPVIRKYTQAQGGF